MLMNDIYIAALVFLTQELVVEPSFFFSREKSEVSVCKTSQFSYSLAFPVGWIPLLCTAAACDDGREI